MPETRWTSYKWDAVLGTCSTQCNHTPLGNGFAPLGNGFVNRSKLNVLPECQDEVRRLLYLILCGGGFEEYFAQHWAFYPDGYPFYNFAGTSSALRSGLVLWGFNPFPHNYTFWRPWETSLLKTLWEKEKLFVTSNFSFSHSVFYPSG